MNVIKRDGAIEAFDKNKIEVAINKAFLEVDGLSNEEVSVSIAEIVEDNLFEGITVEDIQDLVEKKLIESGCQDVAIAYIRYRYLHEMARKGYDNIMDAIREKITASNVQNQNANVDEKSFGGRVGEASDLIMKKFALDYCVSPMAKKNHENNEIYIHDLSAYPIGSHNCLSIPFDDLLANGFNTRQTDVRPAQSLSTAFQLLAVIFQLQSLQQFGGCSATHLDWTMVPYVRKSFYKHFKDGLKYVDRSNEYVGPRFSKDLPIDSYQYTRHNGNAYQYAMDMTKKECYQAVEAMFHNLNTLQSRSGNQLSWLAKEKS